MIKIKKGDQYGMLTIIKEVDSLYKLNKAHTRIRRVLVECSCKAKWRFITRLDNLRTGGTTSCNCKKRKATGRPKGSKNKKK